MKPVSLDLNKKITCQIKIGSVSREQIGSVGLVETPVYFSASVESVHDNVLYKLKSYRCEKWVTMNFTLGGMAHI